MVKNSNESSEGKKYATNRADHQRSAVGLEKLASGIDIQKSSGVNMKLESPLLTRRGVDSEKDMHETFLSKNSNNEPEKMPLSDISGTFGRSENSNSIKQSN